MDSSFQEILTDYGREQIKNVKHNLGIFLEQKSIKFGIVTAHNNTLSNKMLNFGQHKEVSLETYN